jgi:hypothetical protein
MKVTNVIYIDPNSERVLCFQRFFVTYLFLDFLLYCYLITVDSVLLLLKNGKPAIELHI